MLIIELLREWKGEGGVAAGWSVPADEQYISDVLNYIAHGDPQVRGATAILCGTLVCSILSRSRFRVGDWMGAVRTLTGSGRFSGLAFLGIMAKLEFT